MGLSNKEIIKNLSKYEQLLTFVMKRIINDKVNPVENTAEKKIVYESDKKGSVPTYCFYFGGIMDNNPNEQFNPTWNKNILKSFYEQKSYCILNPSDGVYGKKKDFFDEYLVFCEPICDIMPKPLTLTYSDIDSFFDKKTDIHIVNKDKYFFAFVKKDAVILEKYLLSADSRTYQNVIYKTPVFKANAEIEQPKVEVTWAHNMLIHGAPGTGKSFEVDKKAKAEFAPSNVSRVTFYEDYSYEKFVGAYMPVQKKKSTEISFDDRSGNASSEGIAYEFKPGIMAEILAKAYSTLLSDVYARCEEKSKNDFNISDLDSLSKTANRYLLIIEEINRAPAASVFGDMFQLLDRDNDGKSTYSINPSEEFKEWLVNTICRNVEGCNPEHAQLIASELRLPPNLYIWATMNSADQGVFPLDTAFKRRWCYLYRSLKENRKTEQRIKLPINGAVEEVEWDEFREALNEAIINAGCTEEDRLIGTWYFNDKDFNYINEFFSTEKAEERDQMINPLCDKLFAYLRNDVFRNNPEAFFSEGYSTMSELRTAFNNSAKITDIIKKFDKTVNLKKESTSSSEQPSQGSEL